MSPLWTDPDLDRLANSFFRTFARMEYSLKAAGYLRLNRRNVAPDWDRFAREIDHVLYNPDNPDLNAAVQYINRNPPKRQVVVDGQLDWAEPARINDTDAVRTLRHVRQVRNNLFHGGKFNGRWFHPERSGQLIEVSMTILAACRDNHNDILEAYNN